MPTPRIRRGGGRPDRDDEPPQGAPPAAPIEPDGDRLLESTREALEQRRTRPELFFRHSHLSVPSIDPRTWRLALEGEIDWPGQLSLADLDGRPQRSVAAVLECAGDGRTRFGRVVGGEVAWGPGAVGAAEWSGVPLREILEEAGPWETAVEVVAEGEDRGPEELGRPETRFQRSLPLELVRSTADILIATSMNGAPLEPAHGFPARLLVPGWYGMASVKWLRRIRVIDHAFEGPFQTEKYTYRYRDLGRESAVPVTLVRVKSLVLAPRAGDRVALGRPVSIHGRAWSGVGVAAVEVDAGDGWRPARLEPSGSRYDWVAWSYLWTPRRPGPVEISVRATDRAGNAQPETPELNDLQYGENSVRRLSVDVGD